MPCLKDSIALMNHSINLHYVPELHYW